MKVQVELCIRTHLWAFRVWSTDAKANRGLVQSREKQRKNVSFNENEKTNQ